MSHICSFTGRKASQWKIPSQPFPPLAIFVKMFHSLYYLEAMVTHIQCLHSQIYVCVCIYIYIYIYTYFSQYRNLVGQGNIKNLKSSECCEPRKIFLVPTGNACHSIGGSGLGLNCRMHLLFIITYLLLKTELRLCWTFGRWTDCIPCVGKLNTQV